MTRALLPALWILLLANTGGFAEDPHIAQNRAAERKTFTDAEIADGFFKTAFGAELAVGTEADRIRKYDRSVRVFIESRAKPDRRAQVAAVVDDVRAHIKGLDIAVTKDRGAAQVLVTLVRDRDLPRTIRRFYGDRAKRIQHSLDPQCLSGFQKDESFRIQHSEVIVVADAGNYIFYDCIYEELLQSLGPINDSDNPWTMFNDDVGKGFFDIYDQYLLNILYHPRIRPGMTREQVRALLPEIMPSVRAWVSQVNNLPE